MLLGARDVLTVVAATRALSQLATLADEVADTLYVPAPPIASPMWFADRIAALSVACKRGL